LHEGIPSVADILVDTTVCIYAGLSKSIHLTIGKLDGVVIVFRSIVERAVVGEMAFADDCAGNQKKENGV
jgi:hypothetical protein